MKTPRKASPARSQGPVRTPIRHKPRRTLSVSSARSSATVIISALAQQRKKNASFVVSPLGSRKSILSDNTEIEEPRRKSWWTNLGEHSATSKDIAELLGENENVEPNNIIEELDMEILSQENKKNYTMELPESSDNESINSIVITQRKLFPQKENLKQKHFAQIVGPRESLAKQHETVVDKTLVSGTRELFRNKQRSRPIFPAALLNVTPNETVADKTKEFAKAEPKAQVRNIFGQRTTKRKNIFTNFIITESEDEIPDIQPKVFVFQKTTEASRRSSARGVREPSPASSITTDMEMDDWKMLPSSTMVENQLEVLMTDHTPKRVRLSNLTERDSEAGSNTSKRSNKSGSSKEDKSRKSKTFTKEMAPAILEEIMECDYETAADMDKPRKSKTFTKEKSCVFETDNKMINKSKALEDDNEIQNKSIKDTNKSRKSQTFIKETMDLETSRSTRNKSKLQPDENIENKSKTKISEHNTSMKTRSQSKNTSSNNSQVLEPDLKLQTKMKNKTNSPSKGIENIQDNPDEEENDDDELNFSLHYENDNDEEEVIPEPQNKSMTSKIITQKDIITDLRKEDNSMPEKVEESAETKSSQDKNSSKRNNIETNHAQEDQSLHASENPDGAMDAELDQKYMNESKNIIQESEDKQKNESEVGPDEVDHASDNEEEIGKKNESQAADEMHNKDEHETHVAYNASDNEKQDLSLIQNQSEPENENQEVEDDFEKNQNETHMDSDTELNESQVKNESDSEMQNESDIEQNDSQVQNESNIQEEDSEVEHNGSQKVEDDDEEQDEQDLDAEQNESQVQNENNIQEEDSDEEHKENQEVEENDEEQEEEDSDAGHNESDVQDEEQNEIEQEHEQESEEIIESDNENEENHDNSQANGEDSENLEASADDEIIETPNVSHDTTGRNRKKNKSPEAVLNYSRNLIDSYYSVKGDKTVRKTEMPNTTHRDLVPARESAAFSDGSNSSAQGSGWDSHRTTRKTLRQTFGRDFTPRKSLRALVMEKSAKQQTQHNEMASVTPLFPQANSTEMQSTRFDDEDENENIAPNDISLRTRQTTIEKYLMGVAKVNAERRRKIEEKVLKSLNEPPKLPLFKIPATPLFARNAAPKPKQSKTAIRAAKVTKLFGGELPQEVLEDLMYKPPKRFAPRDAPWATKHLYKFLETKLEPKYHYKSRVRAERLVEHVYNFTKDLRRRSSASPDAVEVLKREMARLGVVATHHDFYEFFGQFMPRDVRRKVIPDLINDIDLPRQGVYSDIL